jgi:hypothetical protein
MLSEQEKQRIHEEEIYRSEVRGALPNPNSLSDFKRWSRIWQFINSGFGLWLLSTVVLGLATWGYTRWQTTRESEARNVESIQKLDIEILSRLFAVLSWGEGYTTAGGKVGQTQTNIAPADLVNKLLHPPGSEKMLIPEFANRNLKSLLFELSFRLKGNEKIVVEEALIEIEQIERDYASKQLTVEEVPEYLGRVMKLDRFRWRLLKRHLDQSSRRAKEIIDSMNR